MNEFNRNHNRPKERQTQIVTMNQTERHGHDETKKTKWLKERDKNNIKAKRV